MSATDGSATPAPATTADHHEAHGAFAAAVRVVLSFTLASRFLGLFREVLTARLFGDTALGSAFAAAWLAPNVFRRLFGEGALSAAFLPEYTRLIKHHHAMSSRLASLVIGLLGLVTGVLTALGELALFAAWQWGGLSPDQRLSVELIMLMLPVMPMICTTAILGGMLQAQGKFGPPAAAPIILNLFMIAGAGTYWLTGHDSVLTARVVGVAAVLASIVQIVWSLRALQGLVVWTRVRDGVGESARLVLRRFIPVVIGLGTLQLNTMMDTLIAMWPTWIGPTMFGHAMPLDAASNSILSSSSRFYQFPLGVFGLAVSTAIFPLLSRHADDSAHFATFLRRGVRLSLFIGLPASAGLMLVNHDITRVMLSGGSHSFSAEGVQRAAAALMGFAPAVWAFSLTNVLTRAFYAKGDTRTPMAIATAAVILNLTLNLTLIWWVREAGLAYSTSISQLAQLVALTYFLQRKHHAAAVDRETLVASARLLLATLIMAACLGAVLLAWTDTSRWIVTLSRLLACTLLGMLTYAAAAWALRLPEMRWILQRGPKGGVGAFLVE